MDELSKILYNANCIQFGEFKLVSGKMSPIYINLRMLPSYPYLLSRVAAIMEKYIYNNITSYNAIIGIPLAAISLATIVSQGLLKPLLLARTEKKDHGTKKQIEGLYKINDKILLIDDLITGAETKLKFIHMIEEEGLEVKDIVVVLDRDQGGAKKLIDEGYNLHTLIKMTTLLDELYKNNSIDEMTYIEIKEYFNSNK